MKSYQKYFLIPLFVGVVVALVQFVLPYFFKESKELTYKVTDAIVYFDPQKIGKLEIKINGTQSKYLVSNQYLVENTGQIPLKKVPITFHFSSTDTIFKIYNLSFETDPKIEFGKVSSSFHDDNAKLEIELLNPGDRIFVNILTNLKVKSEVYSKSEGMTFRKEAVTASGNNKDNSFLYSIIASILSVILASFVKSKSISPFKELSELVDQYTKVKNNSDLKILSAVYGKRENYVDVTEKLNSLIKNNTIETTASNNLAGIDPIPNVKKELKIIYSLDRKIEALVVKENEPLNLPQ